LRPAAARLVASTESRSLRTRPGSWAPLRSALAEVGRGVDPAVEPRPSLTVGEAALDPIEAAELAAEVVHHVDQGGLPGGGHDRRAVLERSVVAEDDVQHRLRQIGVEALDRLDLATNPVVAERDLALKPTLICEVDRKRIVVVGLELADIVKQRSGDGDVAIDAREEGGRGADALGDGQRVLEQAVTIAMLGPLAPSSMAIWPEAVSGSMLAMKKGLTPLGPLLSRVSMASAMRPGPPTPEPK